MVERIFEVIRSIAAEGVTMLLVEQNARLALRRATAATSSEGGLVALEGMRRKCTPRRPDEDADSPSLSGRVSTQFVQRSAVREIGTRRSFLGAALPAMEWAVSAVRPSGGSTPFLGLQFYADRASLPNTHGARQAAPRALRLSF
jgi:hypothetical protein